MPVPLPRRKQVDALVARFSSCRRPSPYFRRVGFRINCFEACSAFTRVPACMVAEPPKAALLPECFSPCRYLHEPPRLLPTGATVVGWDSHPPERSALARRTEVIRYSVVNRDRLSRPPLSEVGHSVAPKHVMRSGPAPPFATPTAPRSRPDPPSRSRGVCGMTPAGVVGVADRGQALLRSRFRQRTSQAVSGMFAYAQNRPRARPRQTMKCPHCQPRQVARFCVTPWRARYERPAAPVGSNGSGGLVIAVRLQWARAERLET